MGNKNYKLPVIAILVAAVLIIGLSVLYVLTGGKSTKPAPRPTAAPTEFPALTLTPPPRPASSYNAIILSVNLDEAVITVCPTGSEASEDIHYSGATDIHTKYGRRITAALLKAGDLVTVGLDSEGTPVSIYGCEDAWSYKNILNMTIDPSLRKITIGDTIYRYDDSLRVFSGDTFYGLDYLSGEDVLSAYGIGNYIYLIKVVKGHGLLTLDNYESFIGGSLQIGRSISVPITDNFGVTLSEGEYNVIAEADGLTGEAVIRIGRDSTAVFDLSPFLPEPVEYGLVSFSLDPSAASLYIDGVLTGSSAPASLTYGEHTVDVLLDGYTPYTGMIKVSRSQTSYSINLLPAPAAPLPDEDILYTDDTAAGYDTVPGTDDYTDIDIPDTTSDPGDDFDGTYSNEDQIGEGDSSPDPVDGTGDFEDIPDSGDSAGTAGPEDSSDGLKLIIHCTEGASVFIDDIYKGTVTDGALITGKPSGTVSVRLTLEGYITKYYTVTIDDDGGDAEFSFPDMVRAD